MAVAVQELGESEVETLLGAGSGTHRGAEAGSRRRPTLGDHDEAGASSTKGGIGPGCLHPENPVKDVERRQLAGPCSDECRWRGVIMHLLEVDSSLRQALLSKRSTGKGTSRL